MGVLLQFEQKRRPEKTPSQIKEVGILARFGAAIKEIVENSFNSRRRYREEFARARYERSIQRPS